MLLRDGGWELGLLYFRRQQSQSIFVLNHDKCVRGEPGVWDQLLDGAEQGEGLFDGQDAFSCWWGSASD